MRVAAIGFAILIYGAEIKRSGELCERKLDFLGLAVNEGPLIESAAIFEPNQTFPDFHVFASPDP